MRIDAFRPAEEFKHNMDKWLSRFRNARSIDPVKKVLVPGDPEREMELVRRHAGIPLLKPVIDDLIKLADKFSIGFPGG
jgi:LDH2 family malate/lactate/ureidoglycolate dehydrogenase